MRSLSTTKWGWFGIRLGVKPAREIPGPRFDSVHLHQKKYKYYLTDTNILSIIIITLDV